MKKVYIFISTILTLSLFTACGGADLDNFKDEPEITSIKGILQELSINDDLRGTYKLKTENDEFIGLRSLTIKLGSKQYLNNLVTLNGLMNEEDEVFEVTGVMINEVLSEDSYKGKFVNYRNSDLSFQLKYYDDWDIVEGSSAVAFYPNDDQDLPIIDKEQIKISREDFIYSNNTAESLNELSENNNNDTPLMNYYYINYPTDELLPPNVDINSDVHKIGVDLIDALKFIHNDGKIEFKTYRPGFIYTLTYKPGTSNDNEQVFNEMISEFQFIAATVDAIDSPIVDPSIFEDSNPAEFIDNNKENQTINYKTSSEFYDYIPFESSLYSFTALMPDDWYYAGSSSNDGNVLHHYAFSDSPVEDSLNNEILGLDILSSDIPNGDIITVNNVEVVLIESNNQYIAYRSLDGYNFKIFGDISDNLYDVILTMASSIESIPEVN